MFQRWIRMSQFMDSTDPINPVYSQQNQLSGYLLRKFKNSNGWQKLWVVFTNFCLFFYKTFQVSPPTPRSSAGAGSIS